MLDASDPLISARRFNLDGVEVTVFVHGEDRALAGLPISASQRAVIDLVEAGLGNRAIAARLGVGQGTVRKRREAVFRRLGIHSRAELVLLLQDRRSS